MKQIIEAGLAENLMLFAGLIVLLCSLLYFIVYDKDFKRQLIMAEFNEDYEETRKALPLCSAKDADQLIRAFKERWLFSVEYGTIHEACRMLEAEKPFSGNINPHLN